MRRNFRANAETNYPGNGNRIQQSAPETNMENPSTERTRENEPENDSNENIATEEYESEDRFTQKQFSTEGAPDEEINKRTQQDKKLNSTKELKRQAIR